MKKHYVLTGSILLAAISIGFFKTPNLVALEDLNPKLTSPKLSATPAAIPESELSATPVQNPAPTPETKPTPEAKKPYAYIVMVDTTQLSTASREYFNSVLKLNQIPPTAIGERCTYYGKPDIWCNVQKDEVQAKWIYDYLNDHSLEGKVKMQGIRRLGKKVPNGG